MAISHFLTELHPRSTYRSLLCHLVSGLPDKNGSALYYGQRWHIMTYCSHQDKVFGPAPIFCNVKLLSRPHKYFAIYGTPHLAYIPTSWLPGRGSNIQSAFLWPAQQCQPLLQVEPITPCRKLFTSCQLSFTSPPAYMHTQLWPGKNLNKKAGI